MRAVTIVDEELEWREHADPMPGPGELLVAVRAAGLNGADQLQRRGLYPPPAGAPEIPGLELAGDVVTTGAGTSRFAEGDRVMAVVAGGGQAELAIVHERVAMPVPDGLPWPDAGGFPEVFTTAHDALFTQCELRMGERVLVHGAAGGVGVAGVQLASACGATVVATVRDEERRAQVAALAERVTVVAPESFVDLGPFDVVLELVGAPNLAPNLAGLATGGRIGIIGLGAGARAELDLLGLMATRGRIHGSTLRARPLEEKAAAARRVEQEVLPLVTDGRIRVPVEATYPISDAAHAYDHFARGHKLGKIVLVG